LAAKNKITENSDALRQKTNGNKTIRSYADVRNDKIQLQKFNKIIV